MFFVESTSSSFRCRYPGGRIGLEFVFEVNMEEQKIKQDLPVGANIRNIRKQCGLKQTELVRLLQLEGIPMTRETLVKIERGTQHIRASQLRAIKNALGTTCDELLK